MMGQRETNKFHFSTAQILEQANREGKLYGEFINNANLSSGIYHLKKGATDPQSPHQYDEIYYIISGIGKLLIDKSAYPATRGDILFVPAHVHHKFVEIEEDLVILVFFSKKAPNKDE
jgi:mannose-6-phosphate isomerase-like protein (cupin superfamily)